MLTKPLNTCDNNPTKSFLSHYKKHEPIGFCLYIKGLGDTSFNPVVCTKQTEDEDISKIFVKKLNKGHLS